MNNGRSNLRKSLMKHISVSNVNRRWQESFPSSSLLKSQVRSSCRRFVADFGTEKLDCSVQVLVKSILDYYRMSEDFSQRKVIKLSTEKESNLLSNWIRISPRNLYGRLRKDSELEIIR